jgi:hypothetical protein
MTKGPGPYNPQPHPPHPNPNSVAPGQPTVEIPVVPPREGPSTDPNQSPAGPVDPNSDSDPATPGPAA